MKRIINSNTQLGRWFRRTYLTTISNSIFWEKEEYCCWVVTWQRLFICWRNLKEVQENLNSSYIGYHIKQYNLLDCENPWFHTKEERLGFLQECLDKIK